MGIVVYIDYGKIILSDNLFVGVGMISEEFVGKQFVFDFDEQEQVRGIIINVVNVLMVYNYEGNDYFINFIDILGYVDFGGDVIRVMCVIDGVIIVVDVVEGVMFQIEIVFRQVFREYVKLVFFINKVDRFIKEFKFIFQQMQECFVKVIIDVNRFIRRYVLLEFKDKWFVKVEDGSVVFGSVYYNWVFSVFYMKKIGVFFKDIIDFINVGDFKIFRKKVLFYVVVLDMVVKYFLNLFEVQKYRILYFWRGDINSDVGQVMMNCDLKGLMIMVVIKIIFDKYVGEVVIGCVWSGIVKIGQEVYFINSKRKVRIQQVGIYMGFERINMEVVFVGNIVVVIGFCDVMVGEIVLVQQIELFEVFYYISELVVIVVIEVKNVKDFLKFVEVFRQFVKEDLMFYVKIDEEIGQYFFSGMGEFYFEVKFYRFKIEWKFDVEVLLLIVVYCESVIKQSLIVEGKFLNKYNRFYIIVELMLDEIYQVIREGEIFEGRLKDLKVVVKKFVEFGMDYEIVKGIVDIYNGNMFFDNIKGIQYFNEVMDFFVDGFYQVMDEGLFVKEFVMKVIVRFYDVKIYEDNVYCGLVQIYLVIRSVIYCVMMKVGFVFYELYQKVIINVFYEYMGVVSREFNQRCGQFIDMRQEGEVMIIIGEVLVVEMFGFVGVICGVISGKVFWIMEYVGFKCVLNEFVQQIIRQICQRKGFDFNLLKEQDVCLQQ